MKLLCKPFIGLLFFCQYNLYTIYVLDHRRLFIFCPKLPIKLELKEDTVVILQIQINYIAFCSLLVVTCGVTLTISLGNISTNDDLHDCSTERRLTLAEVEQSNGFGNLLTDVDHHFRLIVLHAMPEVTTFWERYAIWFAPCLRHQAKPG